jgi:hypothetical protein
MTDLIASIGAILKPRCGKVGSRRFKSIDSDQAGWSAASFFTARYSFRLAYAWIVHDVFANAQTPKLVLLWVHAMAGGWMRAFRHVPPLMAFVLGVMTASWLRYFAGAPAGRIRILG